MQPASAGSCATRVVPPNGNGPDGGDPLSGGRAAVTQDCIIARERHRGESTGSDDGAGSRVGLAPVERERAHRTFPSGNPGRTPLNPIYAPRRVYMGPRAT